MPQIDLAKLVASLELQNAKYLKSLDDSNRRLSRFARNQSVLLSKVSSGFRTVTAFARGFISVLSAGALISIVKNTAEVADNLNDLSARLGQSAQQLQAWQLLGERFGVEQSQMNSGIQRLANSSAEAARGIGRAKDAFRLLGINAKTFVGQSLDQKMLVLARAFQNIQDPAERVRLSLQLFGRGSNFLNFLTQGEEGLRSMRKELEGQLWSDEQLARLGRLDDQLTALTQTIKLKLGSALSALLTQFDQLTSTNVIDTMKEIAELEAQIAAPARRARGATKDPNIARTARLKELQDELHLALRDTKSLENQLRVLETALLRVTADGQRSTQSSAMQAVADRLRSEIEILKGMVVESKAIAADAAPVARGASPLIAESDADYAIREKILRDIADFNDAQVELTRDRIVKQRELNRELLAPFVMTTRETAEQMDDIVFGTMDKIKERTKVFQDLFTQNLVQAASGSFDAILQSWTNTLIQMAAKAASAKLFDFLAGGGGGSFLAGAASFFGGGKAAGGPVSAGGAYLVGERGPELFMPRGSGNIVPNGAFGGTNITVNAPNSAPGMEVRIREAVVQAVRLSERERLDAKRRGNK